MSGALLKPKLGCEICCPTEEIRFINFWQRSAHQSKADSVPGENELFDAFNLSEEMRVAVKNFLAFPLRNSVHTGTLLISHNSFAVFLAERIFGCAFVKNSDTQKQLVSVREVFERLIFLRMKAVYSPAEIVARTASQDWMRGANALRAKEEKKRLAND